MPFAVSCPSCGARFSVADELYRRRFAGRIVTVRCKHCEAAIKLDASEPPAQPTQTAPKPVAPSVDKRPKWVPKPAPPPPKPAQRVPQRLVALSPGSLDLAPVPKQAPRDLFQTPPPSDVPPANSNDGGDDAAEDLTDFAQSEPPPAGAAPSETPPLDQLAQEQRRAAPRPAREDVDFLLGMGGNSSTAAALIAPALPTFAEPIESEPPTPRNDARPLSLPELTSELAESPSPSPPAPPVSSQHTASGAPPPAKRRWPVVLLGVGLASVAAIAALSARGFRGPGPLVSGATPTSSARSEALSNEAVAPEPRAAEPHPEPAAPPTEPTRERSELAQTPPQPSVPAPPTTSRGTEPTSADSQRTPAPRAEAPARDPAARSTAPTAAASPAVAAPAAAAREAVAPEPVTTAPSAGRPPSRETMESMATEPFNRAAAASALAQAAEQASACRQSGDPSGTTSATVTFAPSGRVTTATLSGPPFAGTKTGSCIAASLRRARVPPFAGDKVTVGKTVVIR